VKPPTPYLELIAHANVSVGPAEVIGQTPAGERRSTPRFESGDSRYAWLNQLIVVCSGARTPDSVLLDFYAVL